jgi:branched-chain amino acid transport system substrate-binding protein
MQRRSLLAASAFASFACGIGVPIRALAEDLTQGITKDEVLLGTVQDLSGPVVSITKPTLNGMLLRIDQINAAGGVRGRKLRLLVEDTGYDPKRGVLGVQKLSDSDHVFAFVGNMGTAISLAVAPVIADKGMLNLFPISAHRGNFEPFNRLRFALITPFDTGIKIGLNELIAKKGFKKVAILYQDDELGLDNLRATEDVLKTHGLALVERASYKRGATDFSSQVQRLYGIGDRAAPAWL